VEKSRLLPFWRSPDVSSCNLRYTHLHKHREPTYYTIYNGTIDLSNNATLHDGVRRPGIKPGSVETQVDASTDLTTQN